MPRKKISRRANKTRAKRSPINLLAVIRRKIFIFIPVFALLLGLGLLNNTGDSQISLTAWDTTNFAFNFSPSAKHASFEGKDVVIPEKVLSALNKQQNTAVLGESTGEEKWIEVDLSEQKLIAHEGDKIFLESLVSTGLPGRATPTGEYHVWYKVKSQKMSGGTGRDYYYLPNVPFIMFFENDQVSGYRGYSLHGTYWHNDFGNVRSHGCVNLPTPVAEQLYYWTTPILTENKNITRATDENPGTRIVIHE